MQTDLFLRILQLSGHKEDSGIELKTGKLVENLYKEQLETSRSPSPLL